MGIQGIWASIYQVSLWVMRFAYINLLWMLFTVVGLILFGLMPSTVAMFTVIRKWILKDTDIPIFNTFFSVFKKEFLKSNAFMLVILLGGIILYIDFRYTGYMNNSSMYAILIGVLFLASFLYILFIIYIVPVYVHFNLTFIQYLKYSIMIGLTSLHYSVSILVVLAVVYYTSMKVPGLAPFFTFSVSAYVIMFGSNLAFTNLLKKQKQA